MQRMQTLSHIPNDKDMRGTQVNSDYLMLTESLSIQIDSSICFI